MPGINNTRCCVPGCHSKKQPSISFHIFPTKKNSVYIENKFGIKEKVDRRKAWLTRLKIGTGLSQRAVVCSLHFTKNDYFFHDCPSQRRRLKITAVPSRNLPKSSHEASAVMRSRHLQRDKDSIPVTKARVQEALNKFKVDQISPVIIKSCSREPAKLKDRDSPDWVPSVKMGYIQTQGEQCVKRHSRLVKRQTKRPKMDEVDEAWNIALIIEPTTCPSTEAIQQIQPHNTCLPLKKVLKKTAVPTLNLGGMTKGPVEQTVREKRAIRKAKKELVNALLASTSMTPAVTKISRTRSRQETIPSRRTKIKSKKSTSNQNKDTEQQMRDKDDRIFYGPKVKEFENDNKFEVFYLDHEKEKTCTRIPSDSETDDASESNEFDFVQEPLGSQCQETEQVSLGFQHLCRICSATSSLTHLRKCQSLVALFVNITNIEIKVEDNLPKYMCAHCIQKLEDISNFICIAKKNDEKLKQGMLVNEERKIVLSDDSEDVESLNVAEDISNVSEEVISKSSDVTISNNIDLLKETFNKPRLKKYERGQNNIENKKDVHNRSSENQTSNQNDYYSEKKNDCTCWKCGEVYVGLKIPKVFEDLPFNSLKFHCLNCSKPDESPDKEPAIDKTNSRPFKANGNQKVYPGNSSSGEEKKIRCNTCSESFAVSEFVAHQLQTHSVKKKYTCKLCFSSFSHPSLLRRHARRHI